MTCSETGARTRGTRTAILVLVTAIATGCAGSRVDLEPQTPKRGRQSGEASWYGPKFHGRRTANGEVFDMYEISAAHRTLPFGTRVRVENLQNGRSLVVRINDRGPFIDGRILDLSYAAAQEIGMVEAGVVPVLLTILDSAEAPQKTARKRAGVYRVQVGAFREARNARRLAEELRPRYARVEVQSDDRWHRVQIRNIRNERAARRILEELQRQGYDAFLSEL